MIKRIILLIVLCFTVLSCKTYTIPPENFKEQFVGIENVSLELKNVRIAGVYNKKFQSNKLKTIVVRDKENKNFEIVNSPSIEIRVTTIENKRFIMYFDTVYLENDTLYGSKSRLINLKETKIPFIKIMKIEIQDGGKIINR